LPGTSKKLTKVNRARADFGGIPTGRERREQEAGRSFRAALRRNSFCAWPPCWDRTDLGGGVTGSYLAVQVVGWSLAMFMLVGLIFGVFAMAWAAVFATLAMVGIGIFVALLIPFLILAVVFRLGFLLFKIVALVMFVGFLGWLF
jgi:hypothetical protein